MYTPKSFALEDLPAMQRFIEGHSFGSLVSGGPDEPFVTHIPFVLDRGIGPYGRLSGHVARANPHWRLAEDKPALIVFQGPHAYISPRWYAEHPAVPTWNYTAVHVYGTCRISSPDETLQDLDRSLAFFEPGLEQDENIIPRDYKETLVRGIVGIRIEIERCKGKFKLGQHRSQADQRGVVQGLAQAPDSNAQSLLAFMREAGIGLGEDEETSST